MPQSELVQGLRSNLFFQANGKAQSQLASSTPLFQVSGAGNHLKFNSGLCLFSPITLFPFVTHSVGLVSHHIEDQEEMTYVGDEGRLGSAGSASATSWVSVSLLYISLQSRATTFNPSCYFWILLCFISLIFTLDFSFLLLYQAIRY